MEMEEFDLTWICLLLVTLLTIFALPFAFLAFEFTCKNKIIFLLLDLGTLAIIAIILN